MEKVEFKEIENGEKEVIINAKINIGKLHKEKGEKVNEDGSITKTIAIKCYAHYMMELYKDILFNHAKKNNYDDFEKVLEEYCKFYMMDSIGIEHYPIIEKEDGTLEGFKEDFFKDDEE